MDREKVIKGLEVCTSVADGESCQKDCPYYQEVCYGYDQLMRDALALLKEQETANIYKCPNCGTWVSAENVVRCKDCRHCTFYDGEQLADCMIKQGWFPVKPDWFCADGEKSD